MQKGNKIIERLYDHNDPVHPNKMHGSMKIAANIRRAFNIKFNGSRSPPNIPHMPDYYRRDGNTSYGSPRNQHNQDFKHGSKRGYQPKLYPNQFNGGAGEVLGVIRSLLQV